MISKDRSAPRRHSSNEVPLIHLPMFASGALPQVMQNRVKWAWEKKDKRRRSGRTVNFPSAFCALDHGLWFQGSSFTVQLGRSTTGKQPSSKWYTSQCSGAANNRTFHMTWNPSPSPFVLRFLRESAPRWRKQQRRIRDAWNLRFESRSNMSHTTFRLSSLQLLPTASNCHILVLTSLTI